MSWAGPFLPSKIPLCARVFGPQSNTWFLGPIQVHCPNGTTIGSAAFAGLTVVTDRSTDHVCNNRPHLASALIRPKRQRLIAQDFVAKYSIFSVKCYIAHWLMNKYSANR